MNRLIAEMISIRDANELLIHIVCDTDLSIQGFEILEGVQKQLLRRQIGILLELQRNAIKCLGNNLPKGVNP